MNKVSVPEGKSGKWSIEKFTVSEDEAKLYNCNCHGRYIMPGDYTALKRGKETIMSDTPYEMRDHIEPAIKAKGKVLITGLGIGMVLQNCLQKPDVEFATVVEISKDVIDLVAPCYMEMFPGKVEIINADAYEYKPAKGMKFGITWHDIWDNICGDNYESMKNLRRKYGRFSEWQGCWGYHETKAKVTGRR